MALPKHPKADLKRKYKRTFELSLIISVAFLIAAFKLFPNPQGAPLKHEDPPEIIKMKDIERTRQELPPPPPPKPPIPIEAPSDVDLDDVFFEETVIDETDNVPPPPPPLDEKENTEINAPFRAVEEMPEPIGGLTGILERLNYPEMARRAGVQGRVTVTAIVDVNGNVESVELVKGIGMGCDDEAMRVIKETKFKPGKQRGKPVRVYVTIPIRFNLN